MEKGTTWLKNIMGSRYLPSPFPALLQLLWETSPVHYYQWLPTEVTLMRFLCKNQPRFRADLSFCQLSQWLPSSVNDNQSKSFSVCRKTRPHPFALLTKEPRLLIVQRIWWDRPETLSCSCLVHSATSFIFLNKCKWWHRQRKETRKFMD